jgi:membrane-anchored protein YejM (alkaline phosphatase superfamily)
VHPSAPLGRLLLFHALAIALAYAVAAGPLVGAAGLTLGAAAGLVLLAALAPAGRAARWLAPPALAALLLAIAVDARVFALVGVHLYSPIVVETLGNPSFNRELRLPEWTGLALGITYAILCAGEALLQVACARVATWLTARGAAALLALALVAGGATTLGPGAPAARRVPLGDWLVTGWGRGRRRAAPPRAEYPTVPSPRLMRTPNLVVIAVESLRADALDPALMPRLSQLIAAGRCARAQRHFSSSHTTEYGIFSLLYGLDGYRQRAFMAAGVPSLPLRLLRDNGYTVAGGSASLLERWNHSEPLVRQLAPYREFSSERPERRDRDLVDWARAQRFQSPYFLFLFLDSTHIHYAYPPEFEIDRPVVDERFTRFLRGDPEPYKTGIKNRYRNSVRYVDSLIGELADALAADDPALVITGDHGEELWDHGLFGHSAARFEDARVEVPLVLCLPGRAAPPAIPLSGHVDVLPTLLDYAGLPPSASLPLDGRSLLVAPEAAPLVVVSAAGFPSDADELALITARSKYTLTDGAHGLEPTRVTDLDDRPAPAPAGELPSLLARFGARYARFFATR